MAGGGGRGNFKFVIPRSKALCWSAAGMFCVRVDITGSPGLGRFLAGGGVAKAKGPCQRWANRTRIGRLEAWRKFDRTKISIGQCIGI